LLFDAQGVVAMAIEGVLAHAAEIADAGSAIETSLS
jgi:hypothetical protein